MGSSDQEFSTPPPASRQFGITKPISTAGPTETDLKRTIELEEVHMLPSLLFSPSLHLQPNFFTF